MTVPLVQIRRGRIREDLRDQRKLVEAEGPALAHDLRRREVFLEDRPKTRADCRGVPRPCPWYGCKWHLGLEVTEAGTIYYRHLEDLVESCAMDVADRGGATLDEVGEIMDLCKERVRQVEEAAMRPLTRSAAEADLGDYAP